MANILAQKLSRRYPLFTGLIGILVGAAVATLIALAGSVAIEDQFSRLMADLMTSCLGADASPPCQLLSRLERELLERTSAMLLLQSLCALLVLVGLGLLAYQGYRLLVRRLESAVEVASRGGAAEDGPPWRDEFDRMANALATLGARQSGLEAELAWQRRVGDEQLQRRMRALQTAQDVADLFAGPELSEWTLLEAMGLVENVFHARTVAVRLEAKAQVALACDELLFTRQAPAYSAAGTESATGASPLSRLVMSAAEGIPTLVFAMHCRERQIGTLIIELQPGVQATEAQLRLGELFAAIAAIAIAGLSDSAEERRGALLEERSAIAAELHDSLAQSLAFMKIQVARLQRGLDQGQPGEETARIAGELRSGLSAAYGEIRELIATFRAQIGEAGLVASLEEAVGAVTRQTGIEVTLDHDLGRCRLEINEQFHVLQLVREALANVARHSGASRARVCLCYLTSHQLEVTVEDDGKGLEVGLETAGHYGLRIMQERSALLGGNLRLGPHEGGGTRVELSFSPKRLPAEGALESPT